jgi:hypothetical protein
MQPAPELRAFVEAAFRYLSTKNADGYLTQESRDPNAVFIGTDPKEWFIGLAGWEPVVRTMAAGSSGDGMVPADLQVHAMQEGTVAWIAARWTGHLPNGTTLPFRATSVLHQENGAWKEIQFHVSVAVPDEQVASIAQPAS